MAEKLCWLRHAASASMAGRIKVSILARRKIASQSIDANDAVVSAKWHDLSYGMFCRFPHRGRDLTANVLRCPSQRVIIEMRVAGGGRRLRVPQQLAYDRKAETAASSEAHIGVAQIVKATLGEPSALGTASHRLLTSGRGFLGVSPRIAWGFAAVLRSFH